VLLSGAASWTCVLPEVGCLATTSGLFGGSMLLLGADAVISTGACQETLVSCTYGSQWRGGGGSPGR